jgi:hypothetical protein
MEKLDLNMNECRQCGAVLSNGNYAKCDSAGKTEVIAMVAILMSIGLVMSIYIWLNLL